MKLWESSFKWTSQRVCVCHRKEEGTTKTNMIFLKRALVLYVMALITLIVMLIALGFSDTIQTLGWYLILMIILTVIYLLLIVYQLSRGHSLWCSLRRALLTMF